MASTYSTNLKIELQATGENSGTWGTITNTNLGTALEQAIVGYGNPSFASDANLTLTYTDTNAAQAARALVLNVTSAVSLTGTRELVVPTIQKQYIVQNNTTGSQSITVKTSGGTGITVPNGRKAHLYVDGTNVIQMFDFVDINGGAIDGTTVGASSASTGAFTTLTASGATTLNGAVALGDAAADLITVPGTVNSNVIFTDNTFDIGASGATRPRTGYFGTSVLSPLVTATNLQVTNIKANDGTAVAVLTDSTGATDFSKAFTLSATTQNISLGASQTTGTFVLGGTAATGAITLDQSTKAHTLNIGSGATENATTKTINIGTGGVSGSTTTITIGSSNGTTTTFNGTVNVTTLDLTNLEVTNIKAKDGTAAIVLTDSTGAVTISTALTANGGAVFNENGANVDFRVEGDTDANLIFADASADYVGIGTNAPATKLDVSGQVTSRGSVGAFIVQPRDGSGAEWSIYNPTGDDLRFFGNSDDRMVLTNSGNLGLGVVPSAWRSTTKALQSTAGAIYDFSTTGKGITQNAFLKEAPDAWAYVNSGPATQYDTGSGAHIWYNAPSGTAGNAITFSQVMTLDASGNLGLGVTPSAWGSGRKSVDVSNASFYSQSGNYNGVASNAYNNGSNWIYKTTAAAQLYEQGGGLHAWFTAPSGTAGNAITFTQAMTLDASGNLGVGTSSPNGRLQVTEANRIFDSFGNLNVYTSDAATVGAGGAIGFGGNNGTGGTSPYVFAKIQGIKEGATNTWNGALLFGTTAGSSAVIERARITSGGDLLVGGTSALGSLDRELLVNAASAGQVAGVNLGVAGTRVGSLASASSYTYLYAVANAPLLFGTNNTERARITSGGYFKASDNGTYSGGATSQAHTFDQSIDNNALLVYGTNATLSTSGMVFLEAARNTTNNTFYALSYYNAGAAAYKFRVADSGDVTNTNGTYGTISDQKMKTDIVDAGSQWADIKALRFRKFKMKDDPSGLVQLGVVAQEVELTSPGLVDEHQDRDAEGNDLGTTTKSVKTSVLLMKAAVALQEAMARIETLEAEVAALKGA